MKSKILFMLISLNIFAQVEHLPLDLTFEESLQLYDKFSLSENLKSSKNKSMANTFTSFNQNLDTIINSGPKLNLWLKKLNSNRSSSTTPTTGPIRLTSRSTQSGISIERPSRYSPKTVSDKYTALLKEMPREMVEVLYGNKEITTNLSISDADFIKYARIASGLYQTATRWKMMEPYLPHLAQRKIRDIRGFYFLKNFNSLDLKLKNISQITSNERTVLLKALTDTCINVSQRLDDTCTQYIQSNINNLVTIKNQLMPYAQRVWDSYFIINSRRTDIHWSRLGQNTMNVVFKSIPDIQIAKWLKNNVEDEFRLENEHFEMKLNFITGNEQTAFLTFKPGVTPHVTNDRNQIVMDANTNIKEYEVRWTIRHEFGHILGLPDCYTEFYDEKEQVIINYQLDTTDLMCSRAGSMNNRIYQELRRNYVQK